METQKLNNSNSKKLNTDEIKEMLGLPKFHGVKVFEHPVHSCRITLPKSSSVNFNHIPEYLKSNRAHVYATNHNAACGDHAEFPVFKPASNYVPEEFEDIQDHSQNSTSLDYHGHSNSASAGPTELDPDVLSGYEEYLREYCGSKIGQLRITPQSTLSLTLQHAIQVDVTIDGAIRVLNPKSHVAISVNGMGTQSAFMHPMGRVLQDVSTAHLMAYDMMHGCHKFAKLWPQKATFKSSDMTFAYTMDMAGTRTTMSPLPSMPCNDISLPVFYATSSHGPLYKIDAQSAFRHATRGVDQENSTVWTINGVTIKYTNGELRVHRPPAVFIRTSALTGAAGLSNEGLHCTASQGETPHIFVRFGASKMHYNGKDFKLRTLSQAAGFDENNRITLY